MIISFLSSYNRYNNELQIIIEIKIHEKKYNYFIIELFESNNRNISILL
jgi:hypothetical protein